MASSLASPGLPRWQCGPPLAAQAQESLPKCSADWLIWSGAGRSARAVLAPGVSVLQMALIFRSVALTDRTVCGYLLCITYADDGREQPESQSAGMHGTHHEACKACRQAASGCLPNQRSYRWQDRGWSSALDSFPACASALLSATCSQAHLCGLYTLNAAAGFMMCADKPARYIEAEFGNRGKAHGARICMRPCAYLLDPSSCRMKASMSSQ